MIRFGCPRCHKIIEFSDTTFECPKCKLPRQELFSAAAAHTRMLIAEAKKHARKILRAERNGSLKTSSMALPIPHWKELKAESMRRKKLHLPNSKMYEIMAEALDNFFKIKRP